MGDLRRIIADNVARVHDRIAGAAIAASREPNSVRLVAVTKYVDSEVAAALKAAGIADMGESRPQRLWDMAAASELSGVRWHLIGRLQRNKIARTLPLVSLIHSVDSARLLTAIDQHAAQLAAVAHVLLEANVSGEAAKQGFRPDELRRLLPELAALQHVRIEGLMTMAPLEGGLSTARRTFAALQALRNELMRSAAGEVPLPELSMGMSADFEEAIAEGATIVRVGSILFEGLH